MLRVGGGAGCKGGRRGVREVRECGGEWRKVVSGGGGNVWEGRNVCWEVA